MSGSQLKHMDNQKNKRHRSKRGVRKPKYRTYFIFEEYMTEEKMPDQLLRKEIYQNAKQVVHFCNNEYPTVHVVYNHLKPNMDHSKIRHKIYKKKLPIHVERPKLTGECLLDDNLKGWRQTKTKKVT